MDTWTLREGQHWLAQEGETLEYKARRVPDEGPWMRASHHALHNMLSLASR